MFVDFVTALDTFVNSDTASVLAGVAMFTFLLKFAAKQNSEKEED